MGSKIEMIDIQKAYDEGQEAYRQKHLQQSNPYRHSDQRHYAWLDGFDDEKARHKTNTWCRPVVKEVK
jgi:hypothetical protein